MPIQKSLPLLCCGLLLVAAAAQAVTVKDHFEQTVPLKPGAEVRLGNVNGAVTFEAWDRDEVHIVAEKQVRADSSDKAHKLMSQIKIDVVPGASGLRVDTHLPKQERGSWGGLFGGGEANMSVSYKVQVPRQVALDVTNSNGALTVQGVSGDMALKTSNGHISVAHSEGTVKAETSNGGIDAELTRYSGHDLSFETSNGAVSVRLPRDAHFTVDAETSNGGVKSDFPVAGGKPDKRSLKGAVNGGGPRLYIRTSNGGVHIQEV